MQNRFQNLNNPQRNNFVRSQRSYIPQPMDTTSARTQKPNNQRQYTVHEVHNQNITTPEIDEPQEYDQSHPQEYDRHEPIIVMKEYNPTITQFIHRRSL